MKTIWKYRVSPSTVNTLRVLEDTLFSSIVSNSDNHFISEDEPNEPIRRLIEVFFHCETSPLKVVKIKNN